MPFEPALRMIRSDERDPSTTAERPSMDSIASGGPSWPRAGAAGLVTVSAGLSAFGLVLFPTTRALSRNGPPHDLGRGLTACRRTPLGSSPRPYPSPAAEAASNPSFARSAAGSVRCFSIAGQACRTLSTLAITGRAERPGASRSNPKSAPGLRPIPGTNLGHELLGRSRNGLATRVAVGSYFDFCR
jgi:hypothetical protein